MKRIGETKRHYKMYKAGKQWVIGSLTVLGVAITMGLNATHASADEQDSTDANDSSAKDQGTSVASNEVTLKTPATTSAQVASDTTAPKTTEIDNTDPDKLSVASDSDKNTPMPSDDTVKKASDDTPIKLADVTASTVKLDNSVTLKPSKFMAPSAKIAGQSLTDDAVELLAAPDATPTAPTLTENPALSNFLISGGQRDGYAVFGSTVTMSMSLYGRTSGGQLYGVYFVLPNGYTLSGGMANLQSILNDFVTKEKTSTTATGSLASLTVYQLANTANGRLVYYIRPNDGADLKSPDTISVPLVVASADKGITSVKINSDAYAGASTAADMKLSGILFAGIGTNNSISNNYPAMLATIMGITGAPDQNISAISNGKPVSYQKTQNLGHVQVQDTYNIYDTTSKKIIKTITSTPGQEGSTYSRTNLIGSLAAMGLDKNFELNGNSIQMASSTDGGINDTVTYTPSQTFFPTAPTGPVAGKTYTVNVKEYNKAGRVTAKYVTQVLDQNGDPMYDDNGLPILKPLTGLDPNKFPSEATYPEGLYYGHQQGYHLNAASTIPGYTFVDLNGVLDGKLDGAPKEVTYIYAPQESTVTLNYYAVNKNASYYWTYTDNGRTYYTTDYGLAQSKGGSLYILGTQQVKGYYGQDLVLDAPKQNPLTGSNQNLIDYYKYFGIRNYNASITHDITHTVLQFPLGSGTAGFAYIRQIPVIVTNKDTQGNNIDTANDINKVYVDPEKLTIPGAATINGYTIDWKKSMFTQIDTTNGGHKETYSIYDFIKNNFGLTNPTDEEIATQYQNALSLVYNATNVAAGLQFAGAQSIMFIAVIRQLH